MKKPLLKIGILALFGAAATSGITSCSVDEIIGVLANALGIDSTNIDSHTGYDWEEEDPEHLEDDINIVDIIDDDSQVLPDVSGSVDLRNYLPPIGDQGQYGTCVAWASAYNARTFLFAKENNYTTSKLSSPAYHFSPKYVFYAMNNRTSCDGSYFEEVLDIIQKKGVATMQTMPYTNMGNCSGNPSGSQDTEAAKYKIKSYREVNINDVSSVKSYLNQGKVIVFGARLGDEFMLADNTTDYIRTQSSYNYSGMHANHAMVIAGYDDNRGPNGCFLVVNTWGESWGNDGYIWIDQKYLCSSEFSFCGFVLNGFNEAPTTSANKVVNPTSGYDLIPTYLAYQDYEDEEDPESSDDPLWRTCVYNVFNAGSSSISSSKKWAICLLYYNAYNAKDYGVLLVDFYSDEYGDKGDYDIWDADEARSYLGVASQAYCWNNIDVAGGASVAGTDPDDMFSWSFRMPSDLNGQYYLVLSSDAFAAIDESNEDNNYLYFTADNDAPITFVNGIATNVSDNAFVTAKARKIIKPKQNDNSPCQSMVNENNLNTYTTAEISALLNAEKKSGRLKAKALAWCKSEQGKAAMAKSKHIVKE